MIGHIFEGDFLGMKMLWHQAETKLVLSSTKVIRISQERISDQ